jgi:hypothetical protein
MPALPRELLEDFIARWMDANREAERKGDWKGLADKLEYVQSLGVTALWISPIVRNVETDAGIERFDTATSTTRLFVSERDLGGSVSEVAVTDGCGVAIVAGPQRDVNPTSLVTFDPVTGKALSSARAPVLGPTNVIASGP